MTDAKHTPEPTDLYDHPDSEFRRAHILLNKLFDAKGCKCRVEGHGTIPSPVIIDFCPLHAAGPTMFDALEKAADTFADTRRAMEILARHAVAEAMRIAEDHARAALATARREVKS